MPLSPCRSGFHGGVNSDPQEGPSRPCSPRPIDVALCGNKLVAGVIRDDIVLDVWLALTPGTRVLVRARRGRFEAHGRRGDPGGGGTAVSRLLCIFDWSHQRWLSLSFFEHFLDFWGSVLRAPLLRPVPERAISPRSRGPLCRKQDI